MILRKFNHFKRYSVFSLSKKDSLLYWFSPTYIYFKNLLDISIKLHFHLEREFKKRLQGKCTFTISLGTSVYYIVEWGPFIIFKTPLGTFLLCCLLWPLFHPLLYYYESQQFEQVKYNESLLKTFSYFIDNLLCFECQRLYSLIKAIK